MKNHSRKKFDQNTLDADLKVKFNSSSRSQNISLRLKIEKDKKIWLSASVFGFPVAKGVITPEKVQYYIKINKTYFDGDFSEIQKIFGVPLDFTMLQNLLLGDTLFEMKAKNYVSSIDQKAHLLTPVEGNELADLLFWIHPINYKIEKQEIRTFKDDKFLSVGYENFKEFDGTSIPGSIEILVKDDKNNASIRIDYKSVKLNESLSFPYSVPNGYKRIIR